MIKKYVSLIMLLSIGVFCIKVESPGEKFGKSLQAYFILTTLLKPKPAIVFTSTHQDSNGEIYTIAADGSGLARLTNNTVADSSPSWSTDGTKIVYVKYESSTNAEIYIMNSDGSGATRLTNNSVNDASPSFSPDGTRVAFHRVNSTTDSDIITVKTDGTGEINVTATSGNQETNPKWSPNGSKLAYTVATTGSKQNLVTKSSDGSGIQTTIEVGDLYISGFSWSSDSTKLFYSTRDSVLLNFDIKSKNADSSGTASLLTSSNKDEDYPVVSPDGTKVAYTRAVSTSGFSTLYSIYTMTSSGSSQTDTSKNTSSLFSHDTPFWSPDSSMILFKEGTSNIYTMNADGSSKKQINSSTVSLSGVNLGGWTK